MLTGKRKNLSLQIFIAAGAALDAKGLP